MSHLEAYSEMHYRTNRVWFFNLNKQGWVNEIKFKNADEFQTYMTTKRCDTAMLGFFKRNAISAQLHRLNLIMSDRN